MNSNRYCVIMCGGIGSRFWPYSRENKPKQFIDFLGTGRSLLQMSVDRVRGIVPDENIVVVTNAAYLDLIREQCPELLVENILLEPARRNTAPCIAWAASHIFKKTPDASMIVSPSDHIITDLRSFERIVLDGFDFVENNDALLTLGINPTRPETGYGYIKFDSPVEKDIFKVERFAEKPDIDTAREFLADGSFLWNAGIFLWRAETILQQLHKYAEDVMAPFDSPSALDNIDKIFPDCESISIDYAVMEKSDKVFVEKASMGWSDLGTWSSLYDLSEKDENDNFSANADLLAFGSTKNVIKTKDNKLVVVKGLNDYIIADTDNALLICPKSDEQEIKKFVESANLRFPGKYN